MSKISTTLVIAASLVVGSQAVADVTFYEGEEFRGRAFTTTRALTDFKRSGFNDRASSVIVDRGRWEVCEDSGYRGRCVLLRPGNYDSLKRMGINNRVSSARRARDNVRYDERNAPEPLPVAGYEYRRRPDERVHEARVTSVRAVMGREQERCWVEREEIERRGDRNVVGGILGGVIGGVLGHQIGSGSGNDAATVGGAVAGAAIGSNQNRGRDYDTRDVRRCEVVKNGSPEFWDVTYRFRNIEHRVQMSAPPGKTIYVNSRGEPRQ